MQIMEKYDRRSAFDKEMKVFWSDSELTFATGRALLILPSTGLFPLFRPINNLIREPAIGSHDALKMILPIAGSHHHAAYAVCPADMAALDFTADLRNLSIIIFP